MNTSNVENATHRMLVDVPASASGFFVPSMYFLAAGAGDANQELVAFDRALINSGVADVNLVKLSSIVPPYCQRVNPLALQPGSFVGVAFAQLKSSKRGQLIASAVAVAHPTDPDRPSLVMEYSDFASCKEVQGIVIEMAKTGIESRGLRVSHVDSISIAHIVDVVGATFAAVIEI